MYHFGQETKIGLFLGAIFSKKITLCNMSVFVKTEVITVLFSARQKIKGISCARPKREF